MVKGLKFRREKNKQFYSVKLLKKNPILTDIMKMTKLKCIIL